MRHREIPDGIGRWGRPSRRKPPGRYANAAAAHGERHRSGLPGPPGDISTARHATDTWPGRPPGTAAGDGPPPGHPGPGARGANPEPVARGANPGPGARGANGQPLAGGSGSSG